MEQEVEILFKDEIVNMGAELFNLNHTKLEKLGSFENYVFSATQDGQECILRFTHSSHRSKQQVEAELAWLQFLQENGAPVCGPFKSKNGNLVETIAAGDTFFFVSLFEKAAGRAVKVDNSDYNEKLFFAWGKATGILHRLSRDYEEKETIEKRPHLIEEFSVQYAPFIPNDNSVKEKIEEIIMSIKNLPKDKERYRLIHSDIHSGNFFFDGTNVTIFDFDDCSYHHLISDIAIPIYYSVWFNSGLTDSSKFINDIFLPAFMEGYLQEHSINFNYLIDLPLFLKLRDCELYGVLHKKWDLTSLNDKQKALLLDLQNRIVSETPIVEVQLDKIAKLF